MNFLFGRKATPEDFLLRALKKLEKKSDRKKAEYIKKNVDAIAAAIEHASVDIPQPKGKNKQTEAVEAKDKSHIYLNWYTAIVSAISGDSHLTRSLPSSDALEYFLKETQEDAQQVFRGMALADPLQAFKVKLHTDIFRSEIVGAMQTLIDANEPHLFIACHDQLNAQYPSKKDRETEAGAHIFLSLAYMSEMALGQILAKSPNAVLFPRTQKEFNPKAIDYLSYLPDQRHLARFVSENIDRIDMAVRAIAKDADKALIGEILHLSNAPVEGECAVRLSALKELMVAQQVKLCFLAAAGNDDRKVNQALKDVVGHQKFAETFSLQTGKKNKLGAYEILRLTNPSAPLNSEDQDNGVDSKYLWVLKKPKKVLATAFSKAGLFEAAEEQGHAIKDMTWALSALPETNINLPEVA